MRLACQIWVSSQVVFLDLFANSSLKFEGLRRWRLLFLLFSSGDRVSAENFQQHAEHYQRILSDAQKEIAEKQVDTFSSNSNNFNKSDFISQNNSNSENKDGEFKKDIVDGKATNEENAFSENKKIKDCNPLEKSEKTQRKKKAKKVVFVFSSYTFGQIWRSESSPKRYTFWRQKVKIVFWAHEYPQLWRSGLSRKQPKSACRPFGKLLQKNTPKSLKYGCPRPPFWGPFLTKSSKNCVWWLKCKQCFRLMSTTDSEGLGGCIESMMLIFWLPETHQKK